LAGDSVVKIDKELGCVASEKRKEDDGSVSKCNPDYVHFWWDEGREQTKSQSNLKAIAKASRPQPSRSKVVDLSKDTVVI